MIDCVLLTGAGSGIGRAVALRLAKDKTPMILVGRRESLEKTRQLVVNLGGQAEVFECDLEDLGEIRDGLPRIIKAKQAKHWGAVLAAATLDAESGGTSAQDFDRVFRTNVSGNMTVLESCLPEMQKSQFGRVVFFAGGGAAYAYPEFPGYALSKVSTVRLVENLAAVHGVETGISFVCLAPGAVDTPMLARVIAAGGEVKTKTQIDEPVEFVCRYLESRSLALSGRYVHVRDDWQAVLDGTQILTKDQFCLRRIS